MPALTTTGPPILEAIAFVVLLVWLCLAAGRRIMRWLSVSPDDDALAERAVTALALGVGAAQFVPFLLGAVGKLTVQTLRLAIGALAVALAADLIAVVRLAWTHRRDLHVPSPWSVRLLVGLSPALAVAALLALTPTVDPDGLGYHLTVPKRWLEAESLRYLPTYPYSNTPMGVEMLFTVALAMAGDIAAKALHFTLGAAGAFATYLAGKRLAGSFTGALAAVLLLVGPFGVLGLMGWAYLEGIVSFALVASALAWIRWYRSRDPGWLRCAALLSGVGASFKIVAATFPIGMAFLTLAALADDQPSQPGRRSPAAAVLRLTPLFLLPVAPWLLRSWLVTGNPVFPVFARWIPSRDFSPQTSAKFDAYNRYMLWGTRFAAHWSLGRRRALLLALGAAAIFVAGIAFTRIRSRFARATLVIATATVLIQLFAAGIYVRYWIPVMAILTLPLAALVDSAVRGSKRWLVLTAGAALGAVSLARQGLRSVGDDVPGLVASAIGVRDERSFLERHLPLFPLYERVNHAFPSESRLMLVSYCAGFYVDRMTYCADIPQDSLSYASWQTFLSDARRLGVTHVLAPTSLAAGQPLTSTTTGSVSALVQEQESEHVGRLLKERGHLIATAADEGLFEVNLDDGLDPHAP